MKKNIVTAICLLALTISIFSCRKKIKINEDNIYSRHLQSHIPLTIMSTPIGDDRKEINLLLLNDGQDIVQLGLQETIDSLYKKELLQPVLIVAIHAVDRAQIYGVADKPDYQNNGLKAAKYAAFVDDELYNYIKKKTGIRSFKSITMAGCSLGGLSAFDIAWNHADKIDKVGVFSGSFWWRDKDANLPGYTDSINRIMLNTVQTSRKKPHVKYWMYAGLQEENADRDKDGIIDVVDDTKDLIKIINSKKVCLPTDIIYTEATTGTHDYASWSKALPAFILWAVGK
jgi:enterochelin esterase-like enzyme